MVVAADGFFKLNCAYAMLLFETRLCQNVKRCSMPRDKKRRFMKAAISCGLVTNQPQQ